MVFRLKLILLASSAAMAFSVALILSDLNSHLTQTNMLNQTLSPLIQISTPTISFNHDSSCHCPTCLGITTQFLS